jgi:tetratricopeptide (TPR) repeat protein
MIELTMFVLTSIAGGVLGNRSDALLCDVARSLYERLRQSGPPVNHDLQRAIRKALLQATLVLLSDALRERDVDVRNLLSRSLRHLPLFRPKDQEVRWLLRAYDALAAELGRVSDAEYVPPSSVAESVAKRELAFLLEPQGVAAEERGRELRERLPEEWLKELKEKDKEKFGEPPEVFIRRLREGWKPPEGEGTVSWFDLVCAFFAHEVKHNQAVANILTAKLLAGLKAEGQPLGDAFIDYLQKQFAPVLERLEAVQRQLEELGRQQREGFEELKARQAELTAILMPMRETQQVMQALLSEVVRWLRWMAENFGKSHVATYLDDATRQFLQEKWQQGFVGRKEAMERLNRFIAANPNGVAIVYAPAGYGKTTFLAHWIRQVEEAGGWLPGDGETRVDIVRHFFSPTMHLSPSPSHAFAHLLAQLTRLSDQPTPIPDRDDERWAALRNFLADLKLPEGVKLVIVLDGLDDAEGEVEPFDKIPEGLFAVVSGRWDGEGELPNYLKKWAKFTEFIPLKALSEEELREWLRTAGEGELARFAENDDFVRMLREKTDGLPLFVRYLMDDLLQAVKEGRSPEQVLEQTPKGFSEYVKEQLDELERSEELEQQVGSKIWDLFTLLTVTKGALRQDEVEALTGFSRRELKRLRHQVTRWFSIGKTRSPADMPTADMPTYSFAHPLLAEEFRRHLGREARQMEERLLKWCENWREHRSFPYILRHYAEHLYDKWQMTNEQMTYDALCRLALDPDFKQAQTQHLPDEPNLPLKTVQLALDAAIKLEDAPMMVRLLIEHAKRAQSEETPLQAWRRGHRDRALELATEIVFERDHKLGTLWGFLLAWVAESEGEREWAKRFLDEVRKRWEGANLAELGVWQGEMAAFLLGELEQIEGAIEVAGLVLDDKSKGKLATSWASKELFDQALKVAEGIEIWVWRADALREIAGEMAKAGMVERAKEVFDQALEVAEGIWIREWRANALREIAGEMARAGMFERALEVAEGIGMWEWRVMALGEIAGEMAKAGMVERAKEVFDQALKSAERIEDAWWRANALGEIAEGMAKAGMVERAKEVFDQALKVAEGIKDTEDQANALSAIAAEMAKAGMLDQALEVVERAVEGLVEGLDVREQVEALVGIAEGMAKAGMAERAKEVFKQAEQVLKAAGGDVGIWGEEALMTIVGGIARTGMFDQALKVAEGIKRAGVRAEALSAIAEGMAKVGMIDWAKEVFEQALKVAEGIKGARAEALREITEEMAKAGMFDQASQVAEGIEDAENRARALREIAGEMAKAGMVERAKEVLDQALKVAERIEDAQDRAMALREIAVEMAKAGMKRRAQEVFDQALEAAEGIEVVGDRAWALREIAEGMARAGMFDQALKVAEGIGMWVWRVMALGEIAGGMAKAGMVERAKEVFDQALKVAEGIKDAENRARALREIAEEMAKAGMFDQASQVAEGIEDAERRAWALREIAEGMARAGMFDQALKVAEGIGMWVWRVMALGEIAGGMAKAGMVERAKEVLDQALKVAEGIKDAENRARALREIAERMVKVRVQEETLWQQALEVAEGIEDAERRAWALREIAKEMAKAGMEEQAKEVFDQALEVAERIENAWGRAMTLREIAEKMAKTGMFERALEVAEGIENAWQRAMALREIAEEMAKAGMFDQASQVAEGIEDAENRAMALREIAEEMAKAEMKERAREIFDQALKVAEGIEDAERRAWALRKIAEGLAKAGEVEGAVGIVERETGMRTEMLPSVLKALAERAREGDGKSQRGFLRLLPLCGWSLELAYSACGLLARLYPHQAEGIALAVRGMPPAA